MTGSCLHLRPFWSLVETCRCLIDNLLLLPIYILKLQVSDSCICINLKTIQTQAYIEIKYVLERLEKLYA